jgi:hypothetical protein
MFGIRRRIAAQNTPQVEPRLMSRAFLARQYLQQREVLETTAIPWRDQGSSSCLTQETSHAHAKLATRATRKAE